MYLRLLSTPYGATLNDPTRDAHKLQRRPFALPRHRKEIFMIQYTPFWETMKKAGESTYTLINHHNVSSSTIDRLRKNQPLTTTTINDLCRILNCNVEDIALYVASDQDQFL